jgi:hypothetical protein
MDAAKILADALARAAEDRATLVEALIQSLVPASLSPEWSEAIERGEATLVPRTDVRARLRARTSPPPTCRRQRMPTSSREASRVATVGCSVLAWMSERSRIAV